MPNSIDGVQSQGNFCSDNFKEHFQQTPVFKKNSVIGQMFCAHKCNNGHSIPFIVGVWLFFLLPTLFQSRTNPYSILSSATFQLVHTKLYRWPAKPRDANSDIFKRALSTNSVFPKKGLLMVLNLLATDSSPHFSASGLLTDEAGVEVLGAVAGDEFSKGKLKKSIG